MKFYFLCHILMMNFDVKFTQNYAFWKFLILIWDKTYFRPYIFMRFPFWSLTFFFTVFSPYPEKRVSFLSLPLHHRQKLHGWQTTKLRSLK